MVWGWLVWFQLNGQNLCSTHLKMIYSIPARPGMQAILFNQSSETKVTNSRGPMGTVSAPLAAAMMGRAC